MRRLVREEGRPVAAVKHHWAMSDCSGTVRRLQKREISTRRAHPSEWKRQLHLRHSNESLGGTHTHTERRLMTPIEAQQAALALVKSLLTPSSDMTSNYRGSDEYISGHAAAYSEVMATLDNLQAELVKVNAVPVANQIEVSVFRDGKLIQRSALNSLNSPPIQITFTPHGYHLGGLPGIDPSLTLAGGEITVKLTPGIPSPCGSS